MEDTCAFNVSPSYTNHYLTRSLCYPSTRKTDRVIGTEIFNQSSVAVIPKPRTPRTTRAAHSCCPNAWPCLGAFCAPRKEGGCPVTRMQALTTLCGDELRQTTHRQFKIKHKHPNMATQSVSPYATYGAGRAVGTHYAPTRIHWADYSLCHRRDGSAGTTIHYHLRIHRGRTQSLSVMTTGRRELLKHGHRRRIRRGRRTFPGTTGRTEQQAE